MITKFAEVKKSINEINFFLEDVVGIKKCHNCLLLPKCIKYEVRHLKRLCDVIGDLKEVGF